MGNIVKMSPKLANMIAAGEVVERPSSVVKELVENAIDAKANNIKIILKNGGLDEILIIDDGIGMDKDDVIMSFLPHATSKIKTEYDLFRINTLGFRGEAIASISSVSLMNITSSTDGKIGYSLTYKAGVMQSGEVTNHNKGTSVSVKNLFFNTPARLKYLKPAKNELASVSFLVDKLALSHKDISFTLINDDREILKTSPNGNLVNLIGEIYGLETAKSTILDSYKNDGYSIDLVLVKPSIYRSTKLEISLIVNGRYIKNYTLTEAVISGYNTLLPIGKYPIAVVYLDIDPIMLDVNIHPAKTEIKISEEYNIGLTLTSKIKQIFSSISNIPERSIDSFKKTSYPKQTIFEYMAKTEDVISTNAPSKIKFNEDITIYDEDITNDVKTNTNESLTNTKTDLAIDESKNDFTKSDIDNVSKRIPYMEYVGQIFGTYLIFQNSKGMYLMDQHAAAERINYEKYYKMLSENMDESIDLIIPITIEFTKDETIYLLDNLNGFKNIGFIIEQIGERSFVVRSVPLWAKIDNLESIIYDVLSLMIDNKKIDPMAFRDSIAKQIACKASIKANHYISDNERNVLLTNLNKCKNPFTCPHGRPTIIEITLNEIEQMFERIQK